MTTACESKKTQLIERQLVDIQSQAERILSGQNSPENIETFARYSEELKKYIEDNSTNMEMVERVRRIEQVNFKRNGVKFWHILTFSFWIVLWVHYIAKQRSIEEVARAKSDWSVVYMIYKSTN